MKLKRYWKSMGIVLAIGISHALISILVLLGISGELGSFEAHDEFLISLTPILGFPVFEPAHFFGFHVVNSLGKLALVAFALNSLLWGIGGLWVFRKFEGRLAGWIRGAISWLTSA